MPDNGYIARDADRLEAAIIGLLELGDGISTSAQGCSRERGVRGQPCPCRTWAPSSGKTVESGRTPGVNPSVVRSVQQHPDARCDADELLFGNFGEVSAHEGDGTGGKRSFLELTP